MGPNPSAKTYRDNGSIATVVLTWKSCWIAPTAGVMIEVPSAL